MFSQQHCWVYIYKELHGLSNLFWCFATFMVTELAQRLGNLTISDLIGKLLVYIFVNQLFNCQRSVWLHTLISSSALILNSQWTVSFLAALFSKEDKFKGFAESVHHAGCLVGARQTSFCIWYFHSVKMFLLSLFTGTWGWGRNM